MKPYLIIIFLLWAAMINAQGREVYIGVRATRVQSQLFDHGSNHGMGIFGGTSQLISQNRNLYWRNMLGVDWAPACNDPEHCITWWYEFGFRISSYIEKIIYKTEHKDLSLAFGGNIFFGNKLDYLVSIDPGGEVLYSEYQYQFEFGLGLLMTYSNTRINERIRFSYGMDVFWFRQLHSLALTYRLGK